ncbi:MAG TPA: hypothetical protein PL105_18390, partial [Caldilineaceae bacterium]|nr:hypothetical protein [Caldilineaceae bacterium]
MIWYIQDEPVKVYADVRYRADTRADETTTFQRGADSGNRPNQLSMPEIAWSIPGIGCPNSSMRPVWAVRLRASGDWKYPKDFGEKNGTALIFR